MELSTINKLFLELSQFATAKTKREMELEDLLTSARAIAERRGQDTAWERFSERLAVAGIGSVTAKVFKVLPSDSEATQKEAPKGACCEVCGLPMLPSESMFKFHGYSESCEEAKARLASQANQ